jgi:hypothetical protein
VRALKPGGRLPAELLGGCALVSRSRKIEVLANRRYLVNNEDSRPSCEAIMDLLENTTCRLNFEVCINDLGVAQLLSLRVDVVACSSWPASSGPPVAARAGIASPDEPSHDVERPRRPARLLLGVALVSVIIRGAKRWTPRNFLLAPFRLGRILCGCAATTVALRAEPSRAFGRGAQNAIRVELFQEAAASALRKPSVHGVSFRRPLHWKRDRRFR